jgi:hypothetical protein
MAFVSNPLSTSQILRVERVSKKGIPLANPIAIKHKKTGLL